MAAGLGGDLGLGSALAVLRHVRNSYSIALCVQEYLGHRGSTINRLVILGDVAVGKSTLAHRLFPEFATRDAWGYTMNNIDNVVQVPNSDSDSIICVFDLPGQAVFDAANSVFIQPRSTVMIAIKACFCSVGESALCRLDWLRRQFIEQQMVRWIAWCQAKSHDDVVFAITHMDDWEKHHNDDLEHPLVAARRSISATLKLLRRSVEYPVWDGRSHQSILRHITRSNVSVCHEIVSNANIRSLYRRLGVEPVFQSTLDFVSESTHHLDKDLCRPAAHVLFQSLKDCGLVTEVGDSGGCISVDAICSDLQAVAWSSEVKSKVVDCVLQQLCLPRDALYLRNYAAKVKSSVPEWEEVWSRFGVRSENAFARHLMLLSNIPIPAGFVQALCSSFCSHSDFQLVPDVCSRTVSVMGRLSADAKEVVILLESVRKRYRLDVIMLSTIGMKESYHKLVRLVCERLTGLVIPTLAPVRLTPSGGQDDGFMSVWLRAVLNADWWVESGLDIFDVRLLQPETSASESDHKSRHDKICAIVRYSLARRQLLPAFVAVDRELRFRFGPPQVLAEALDKVQWSDVANVALAYVESPHAALVKVLGEELASSVTLSTHSSVPSSAEHKERPRHADVRPAVNVGSHHSHTDARPGCNVGSHHNGRAAAGSGYDRYEEPDPLFISTAIVWVVRYCIKKWKQHRAAKPNEYHKM